MLQPIEKPKQVVPIEEIKPKEFAYEKKLKEQQKAKQETEDEWGVKPEEIWGKNTLETDSWGKPDKPKKKVSVEQFSNITHPKHPGLTKDEVSNSRIYTL